MELAGKGLGRRAATAAFLALALGAGRSALHAQVPAAPAPAPEARTGGVAIDTVEVRGNSRVATPAVAASAGIRSGSYVTAPEVQRVIRRLMATGNFETVNVLFSERGTRTALVLEVVERPLISSIEFRGLKSVSASAVRDSAGLKENAPLDPQRVAAARKLVRDMLAKKGIQLVSVDTSLAPASGAASARRLIFNVKEGNRLSIADIDFVGNAAFSDDALASAMDTKEEGFFWFRTGKFDREKFNADLRESLPSFYGSRGYIDFAVVSDTIIVDPQSGKARLVVGVSEGPRYRLGEFKVSGNARFPTDELTRLFTVQQRSVLGLPFGGQSNREQGEVFDRAALDAATRQAEQLYRNEGYLYAQVAPVIERAPAAAPGADPVVNVSWAVSERSPFYIRKISFVGNTTTHESVIRDRLWILPGDVYNEERVIQSYQGIGGLGFFETPMPFPDIRPDPESGQVDVVFTVKEKQTGNVNFGASAGGGYGGRAGGVAGFLGYQQPNLFGQGKSANLRAEYGNGRSTLEAGYSDPALLGSRNSGNFSVFHTGDRYASISNGRRTRTGASVQFGVPVPGALRTRAFLGYTISRTRLTAARDTGCEGSDDIFCQDDATASSLSAGVTRDTKNHPLFPTAGTRQMVSVEQTGGPIGGDGNFQKVTTDMEWWAPVARLGSGPRPIRMALGLQARTGMNFGDARLFPFEQFYAGGTQFGQPLRGYNERTITPLGYSELCGDRIFRSCLGNAFLTVTAQYAVRITDALSIQAFGDAGNVYSEISQVDPTRLFRSAGVGATLVTPFLGAIGIDAAYGFDRPRPGWELHFKLGQGM